MASSRPLPSQKQRQLDAYWFEGIIWEDLADFWAKFPRHVAEVVGSMKFSAEIDVNIAEPWV